MFRFHKWVTLIFWKHAISGGLIGEGNIMLFRCIFPGRFGEQETLRSLKIGLSIASEFALISCHGCRLRGMQTRLIKFPERCVLKCRWSSQTVSLMARPRTVGVVCGAWLRINPMIHFLLFWYEGLGSNSKAKLLAFWGLVFFC